MNDKVYLNSIQLEGINSPSWRGIPDEVWRIILSDFFFKLADSFGFMKVLEKKDLFPKGLLFFNDWNLEDVGLVEVRKDFVCKFKLNENCKQKLLEKDFAVHQKGNLVDYKHHDELNYYYEFDELYFFSGDRLIGAFINHEDMVEFKNLNENEGALLNKLDEGITGSIINTDDLGKAFEAKRKEKR